MRTSYKKGDNLLHVKKANINVTPLTPRKQLNFTSQKLQKYNISCSKREQDQENLKNNLLLTYLECQNCSSPSQQKQVLKFSTHKQTSPILLKQLQNDCKRKTYNGLIVSYNIHLFLTEYIIYIYREIGLFLYVKVMIRNFFY